MKVFYIVVGFIVTATLAHAEDMAQMISQYRGVHRVIRLPSVRGTSSRLLKK